MDNDREMIINAQLNADVRESEDAIRGALNKIARRSQAAQAAKQHRQRELDRISRG